MKKNNKNLSKEEIKATFKKLADEKNGGKTLQNWLELSHKNVVEMPNVWILTDSSSAFTNTNNEIYG